MRTILTLVAMSFLTLSACTVQSPLPFTPTPTATAIPTPTATPTRAQSLLSTTHESWRMAEHSRYRFDLEWKEPDGTVSVATIQFQYGTPRILSGNLPSDAPKTIDALFSRIATDLNNDLLITDVDYSHTDYPRWGHVWPAGQNRDDGIRFIVRSMVFDEFFERQAQLDEAVAKWESHGLTDYTFDIEIWDNFNLDHPSPIRVVVVDGTVSEHFRVDPDRPFAYNVWSSTIDELFGVIQSYINKQVAYLSVEFDGEYGYPLEIRVDGDASITDDELTYVVQSLVPVQ